MEKTNFTQPITQQHISKGKYENYGESSTKLTRESMIALIYT
jgi:hypothetical protein